MFSDLSILIFSVSISIFVSGLCSLMEAALYAVPVGYIKHKAEQGSKAGIILQGFKTDMSQPIAAILILNTIAHTAGASVAGWAVGEMFGSDSLAIFSIIFTLAILYFSEILPKLVGVVYSKYVSSLIAYPLLVLIFILKHLSGFLRVYLSVLKKEQIMSLVCLIKKYYLWLLLVKKKVL